MALLQGDYSEALLTPVQLKWTGFYARVGVDPIGNKRSATDIPTTEIKSRFCFVAVNSLIANVNLILIPY